MGRQVNMVVEFECDVCGLSVAWGGSVNSGVTREEPPDWKQLENWEKWWCPECLEALQEASDDARERIKAERRGINKVSRMARYWGNPIAEFALKHGPIYPRGKKKGN